MKNKYFLFSLLALLPCMAIAQIDDDFDLEQLDAVQGAPIKLGDATISSYRLGDGINVISSNGAALALDGYFQAASYMRMYSGDEDTYNRFRIRRARLRLNGKLMGDKVRYRLGLDMTAGGASESEVGTMLFDAWVAYRPWGNKMIFTIGQRSTPTDNRELQMSSYSMQLPDRSRLSSVFGTVREAGLFAEGTYKVGQKSYLRPSLAITDGDGPMNGKQRYGGLKYGGRINYLPFGLFRISGETRQSDMVYEMTPKLSLGAAYSYCVGTIDRRGGEGGEPILYLNDMGEVDLPDYRKFTADAVFKYRGFSAVAEYAWGDVVVPSSITQRVRNDGTTSTTFDVDGRQDVTDYIANRMMCGRAYNIQAGYLMRNFWSVDARYTRLMPFKYSYMNNDLYYNRNHIYEAGVSKYLSRSYASRIQASYILYKSNGISRKVNDETFTGWEKLLTVNFQLMF